MVDEIEIERGIKALEEWMTESCSRNTYSAVEVRNRLFDAYVMLSTKLAVAGATPIG